MNFIFLNIPVIIEPSFWIFLLLFTDSFTALNIETIIRMAIVIISVLFHEYGHGLAALKFGAKPTIILQAFGGKTQYRENLSKKANFLITLNGPLFTGILISLAYFLLKNSAFQVYYLRYFLYVTFRLNILWLLFNISPIYPLDGGQLLTSLLVPRYGDKGTKAIQIIGLVWGLIGGAYCLFIQYYFLGIFFIIYGFRNAPENLKSILLFVRQTNFQLYHKSITAIEKNELKKAKNILKKMLRTKDIYFKTLASEALAKILCEENKHDKAYNLLLKTDNQKLKEGKLLLCQLAYKAKNYTLIEKYSQEIYEIEPSYETALLNSKAFAGINNPEYAGSWMQTASLFENTSKEDLKNALMDKIYNNVRENKSFKKYVDKSFVEITKK